MDSSFYFLAGLITIVIALISIVVLLLGILIEAKEKRDKKDGDAKE